jgi:hypothetical protein
MSIEPQQTRRCPWCECDTSSVVFARQTICDGCGFWWLAPTPSDDGEPITREWAESTFGIQSVVISNTMSVWIPSSVPVLVINASGVTPPTEQVHDEPLYHIRTRGQLRALLAALGWQREEPTDDQQS